MAWFCYSGLALQNRLFKITVTVIRTVTTLALLFFALDATIIISRTTGSRLYIVGDASHSRNVERLLQDDRLNDRFQVEMSPEPPPEFERAQDCAAIVIASQTAAGAVRLAELYGKYSAAPIFVTLEPASSTGPEVAINSIAGDGKAMLGCSTAIQVTLRALGMAGKTTRVELADEARILATTPANWKSEDESVVVRLSFIPLIEGVNRLSIRVVTGEREAATANSEMKFSLDVKRAERRILFLENQPTWEGKFIRRALEERRLFRIDYFAQISREAVLAQAATSDNRDLRKILASFNLLAEYDAIIAGPLESAFFSAGEARNINDFIERRGGGLVILGSNDFSGSIISPSSPLAHLSPADVSLPNAKSEASTFMVPTEEGIAEGLFQSQPSGVEPERLGPITTSYLKVSRLKPGAVALAKDGSSTVAETPVLVAAQFYGLGRTILVSPSDLWRAMLANPDESENRFALFWQNVAFLATAKAEPASHIRLASPVVSAGQLMTAYLTARDESFNPLSELDVEAETLFFSREEADSPERLPVTLEREIGAPGVYRLTARMRQEGRGDLRVKVRMPGRAERDLSLAFDVQPENRQPTETPDRLDLLNLHVRERGGHLFSARESERLVSALMELPSESREIRSAYRFRESLFMAFFLPLLMSVEYLLRRLFLVNARRDFS